MYIIPLLNEKNKIDYLSPLKLYAHILFPEEKEAEMRRVFLNALIIENGTQNSDHILMPANGIEDYGKCREKVIDIRKRHQDGSNVGKMFQILHTINEFSKEAKTNHRHKPGVSLAAKILGDIYTEGRSEEKKVSFNEKTALNAWKTYRSVRHFWAAYVLCMNWGAGNEFLRSSDEEQLVKFLFYTKVFMSIGKTIFAHGQKESIVSDDYHRVPEKFDSLKDANAEKNINEGILNREMIRAFYVKIQG